MVTIKLTIDRIEDGVAICIDEEGKTCDFPFYSFPEGSAEGSVVECLFEGNDLVSAKLLSGETETIRTENESRLRSLFSKFRKSPDQ